MKNNVRKIVLAAAAAVLAAATLTGCGQARTGTASTTKETQAPVIRVTEKITEAPQTESEPQTEAPQPETQAPQTETPAPQSETQPQTTAPLTKEQEMAQETKYTESKTMWAKDDVNVRDTPTTEEENISTASTRVRPQPSSERRQAGMRCPFRIRIMTEIRRSTQALSRSSLCLRQRYSRRQTRSGLQRQAARERQRLRQAERHRIRTRVLRRIHHHLLPVSLPGAIRSPWHQMRISAPTHPRHQMWSGRSAQVRRSLSPGMQMAGIRLSTMASQVM